MSKPAIPDPVAAAQRVRDAARDLAADVSEGYRKSNRYTRLRAAIGAGAGLVALLSLLVAFRSGEEDHTALLVRNTAYAEPSFILALNNLTGENWEDVTITIDGGWTHFVRTIRAGARDVPFEISKFRKDGLQAPQGHAPAWVEIGCRECPDERFKLERPR